MKKTLTIIAFAVVLYLIGAFVAGTFDSMEWDPVAKLLLALVWVFGLLAYWINTNED